VLAKPHNSPPAVASTWYNFVVELRAKLAEHSVGRPPVFAFTAPRMPAPSDRDYEPMATPPDRRFRSLEPVRHSWLAVAALLALAVWGARPAAAAGTLVGISMTAQPGDAASGELDCCKQQMSADGAFVAFLSSATDLVAGGSGPVNHKVYLWERATGTVTLVSESTAAAGQRGNANSTAPASAAPSTAKASPSRPAKSPAPAMHRRPR
jgi:hypothetical protein